MDHVAKSNVHVVGGDGAQEKRDEVRNRIRRAIERRRQAITYGIARIFLDSFEASSENFVLNDIAEEQPWVRVESLSQLRATVGGRFRNLKERWVNAGFPLREHRGDRQADAEVDQKAWVELALWMNKQGFEARLANASDPWLFEVRKFDAPES